MKDIDSQISKMKKLFLEGNLISKPVSPKKPYIEIKKQFTENKNLPEFSETRMAKFSKNLKPVKQLPINTLANIPVTEVKYNPLNFGVPDFNAPLKPPVTKKVNSTAKKYFHVPGKFNKNVEVLCLNGYELKKFVAEGAYGAVLQVCNTLENNCQYALKIQKFAGFSDRERWEFEVKNTEMLSKKYNIGPKFVGFWLCENENTGISVAELWSRVLSSKDCLSPELLNKLSNEIKTINGLGLVHGDILEKNVLVKTNSSNNITDITLTDFGIINTIDVWKSDLENKNYFGDVFTYYHYPQHPEFFDDNNFDDKHIRENPELLDYGLWYHFKKKSLNC
jgi:hypothetical protein